MNIQQPLFKRALRLMIPSKKLRSYLKRRTDSFLELRHLKKAYPYLSRYYKNSPLQEGINFQEVGTQQLPVWQLWLQGESSTPPIVKKCLSSVKKYIPEREIILLTENTWQNYIVLPDFIMSKFNQGIITYTHFSDILRICLLEKYGGTWIDSTVLLTAPVPSKIMDANFFAFAVPNDSAYTNYHLTSSWFIHAKPNHLIIKSLKHALFNYWKNENILINYFLLHLLLRGLVDSNPKLNELWKTTPLIFNKAPHELQFNLLNTFNQNKLDDIKKNSTIHKLTYKIDIAENHNTFLNALLNNEIY